MLAVYRLGGRWVSLVGVSVFGALASNAVQIALSVTFIFGSNAWVIAPLFLAIGVGSGFAVGLVAQRFTEKSNWLVLMEQRYLGG
jgi:heptaprenyl diphosphate synthase